MHGDTELLVHLLKTAESLFGPRDDRLRIGPLTYAEDGPYIYFPRAQPGTVSVMLSLTAKGYWPTRVFELSHEVIHLLDPVVGATNYLEEGIAASFQLIVMKQLAESELLSMLPLSPSYIEAHDIVWSLGHPLKVGRAVRHACGAFCLATAASLSSKGTAA